MHMAFFNAQNIKQKFALTGAVFIMSLLALGLKASAAVPGSLSITEFMANPAVVTDANGEWIELTNTSAATIDLTGWDIDGSTISGSPFVRPGHSLVICKKADTVLNGGVVCDATSNFSLSNTADTINVRDENNLIITSLSYGENTIEEGKSNYADLSKEMARKYNNDNFGTPSHNQTTPPVLPGEVRVHHTIDYNNNLWPDFNAGEPHFKGRVVRLYQLTSSGWTQQGEVETTGLYYAQSAKFVVDPGKYALCELATPGYTQSFSRTITGWYSAPEVGIANQSGANDEYGKCIPVHVSSGIISSHVFGDTPVLEAQ